MSDYVPTKQHIREVLLYCYNVKKKATAAHRWIEEVYPGYAPDIRVCQRWFKRFKSGNYHIQDKKRPGQPKKFKNDDLQTLLDEDSSRTQEELAEILGVTRACISHRLKALGMVQKQGNWLPYKLKPTDVEQRLFICDMLLARQKKENFLHRLLFGGEKCISLGKQDRHASTSSGKPSITGNRLMLCIWWDQLGVVYYELLQPDEIVTEDVYRRQLMCLSQALEYKKLPYYDRTNKVILQHENTESHNDESVKEYLETLQWEVLPHPPFSPDVAPSDYHLFRAMTRDLAEQHFTCYDDVKSWVDSWIASKDDQFFVDGINELPERWTKVVASNGQYFE